MKKKTSTIVKSVKTHLLQAKLEEAQRNFMWGINDALFGDHPSKPLTLWQHLIKRWNQIRVWLAERIGGDSLHEECY